MTDFRGVAGGNVIIPPCIRGMKKKTKNAGGQNQFQANQMRIDRFHCNYCPARTKPIKTQKRDRWDAEGITGKMPVPNSKGITGKMCHIKPEGP